MNMQAVAGSALQGTVKGKRGLKFCLWGKSVFKKKKSLI
jgi:hypothetical protein